MGFYKAPESLVGVVVRAGTMDKVVKVRRAKQKFDSFLQKYFTLQPAYFITDPRNSTRTGDVVRFAPWPYYRGSKRVKHIVTEIISAFGPRLEERPAVPTTGDREEMVQTMEERVAEKRRARYQRKREAKEAELAKRRPRKKAAGTEGKAEAEEKIAQVAPTTVLRDA